MKHPERLFPIFLLAFLSYAETLQYWFVGKDTFSLIETSRILTMNDAIALFTEPLMHDSAFVAIALFYRPVASLSYALDYWLWGLDPFGYHLTNVVLHGIAAVLVAYTVAEITNRSVVGLLSAALFAIHPLTVEVVPSAERRQDILMVVFVLTALVLFVRWWRTRNTRTLVAAMGAYALALGSKETGVVFSGLVLAWVLIYHTSDDVVSRFRASIRVVMPFVLVTLGYLVVRLFVLGGIGGYRKFVPPYSAVNVLLMPIKYLLWVFYPTTGVEAAVSAVLSIPFLVVFGLLLLLAGFVAQTRLTADENDSQTRIAAITALVGFGAIPLVLVFAPRIGEFFVADDSAVVSYTIGVLFIGGCAFGIVAAARARDQRFDASFRRHLLFFGAWLVLPLGLLLLSRTVVGKPLELGIQMRNGYLSVVPAMAGVSLVLYAAGRHVVRSWSARRFEPGANAVLAWFVLLLLLPSFLAASPLFHPLDEWESSGELNEQALTDVDDALTDHPSAKTICIVEFPTEIAGQSSGVQQIHSVTTLNGRSISSWVSLHNASREPRIRLVHERTVTRVPDRFTTETRTTDNGLVVRVHTSGSQGASGPGQSATHCFPGQRDSASARPLHDRPRRLYPSRSTQPT